MLKTFVAVSTIGAVMGTKVTTFGPKGCVSVSKSEKTGTCVIQTNCQNYDLDKVEFSFTCQLPNMIQKHSFGKGGFDSVETFDTSVKCDECGIPQEVNLALENSKKQEIAVTNVSTKSEKKDSVTYGPSSCVSTWLKKDAETNEDGEAGTCQVETKCGAIEEKTFEDYPMGLVCVDKTGMPTRHLFGSNSFDKEENFDTLIRCTSCLGLDKVSESVTLEATVKSLAKEVYEIKEEVYKLEKNVDGTYKSTEAAAAAPAAAPAAAEEAPAEEAEESEEAAAPAPAAGFMHKKTTTDSEDSSESEDNNEESESED